jgi:ligand-binding SRPBCC domain-containing protein
MSKTVQTLLLGAVVTLGTGGVAWMVSTLISVDKRTEVMDVKIDHLVGAVEDIKERQFSFDKQGTNLIPSIQASIKGGN